MIKTILKILGLIIICRGGISQPCFILDKGEVIATQQHTSGSIVAAYRMNGEVYSMKLNYSNEEFYIQTDVRVKNLPFKGKRFRVGNKYVKFHFSHCNTDSSLTGDEYLENYLDFSAEVVQLFPVADLFVALQNEQDKDYAFIMQTGKWLGDSAFVIVAKLRKDSFPAMHYLIYWNEKDSAYQHIKAEPLIRLPKTRIRTYVFDKKVFITFQGKDTLIIWRPGTNKVSWELNPKGNPVGNMFFFKNHIGFLRKMQDKYFLDIYDSGGTFISRSHLSDYEIIGFEKDGFFIRDKNKICFVEQKGLLTE